MIEFEKGSTNVYADLGFPDADEMLRKAELATEIGRIIKGRQWTQQKAAETMGLSQPKLSELLRGRFRGISETKLLEGLARLGRDLQITIGPARRRATAGRASVVFR
jgi:predicted XRE-type DNA-binding protein